MVQIAISMTCPKNTIEVSNTPVIKNGMIDFESQETVVISKPNTEISDDERATVAEMMRRFGL